ncbi:MAG: glycoside hydrolase family 10 protein, partial [Chroococcales cyanobacterium metabat2.561]
MLGSSFRLDHLFNKPLIACLLSCVGVLLPIPVLATPVAVLKSQENANQWTDITDRLQNVGVNYCILQSNQWQSDADLNKIKVLIIPNVETISGLQASVLSRWLNRGGKIIVTGPAGNLSEAAVRDQLRSLFGAYWAYPHSQAYTLRPTNLGELKNQKPLASSLLGGVVIPTGVNSQTVAVWGARNNPPAVVLNNNSIFLGWRWGSDAVANLALDSAWLETALQRYGINRSSSPSTIAPYCQGQSTIVDNINNKP